MPCTNYSPNFAAIDWPVRECTCPLSSLLKLSLAVSSRVGLAIEPLVNAHISLYYCTSIGSYELEYLLRAPPLIAHPARGITVLDELAAQHQLLARVSQSKVVSELVNVHAQVVTV